MKIWTSIRILSILSIIGFKQLAFASQNTTTYKVPLSLELQKNHYVKVQILPATTTAIATDSLLGNIEDLNLRLIKVEQKENNVQKITLQNNALETFSFLTKNNKIIGAESLTQNLVAIARLQLSSKLELPLQQQTAKIQYHRIECENTTQSCKLQLNVLL